MLAPLAPEEVASLPLSRPTLSQACCTFNLLSMGKALRQPAEIPENVAESYGPDSFTGVAQIKAPLKHPGVVIAKIFDGDAETRNLEEAVLSYPLLISSPVKILLTASQPGPRTSCCCIALGGIARGAHHQARC